MLLAWTALASLIALWLPRWAAAKPAQPAHSVCQPRSNRVGPAGFWKEGVRWGPRMAWRAIGAGPAGLLQHIPHWRWRRKWPFLRGILPEPARAGTEDQLPTPLLCGCYGQAPHNTKTPPRLFRGSLWLEMVAPPHFLGKFLKCGIIKLWIVFSGAQSLEIIILLSIF